jgi:predicted pyridoxine 5'-phosphate oxidase superfamily flavin-nucleotide-binding protein
MIKIDLDAKKIIENNPIAFSTIDNTNKPNVIAVAYVKVVSNNQLLITDNFMKQTKENLVANNNVCLAVWDKDWNGYKISGTANYFIDGPWKKYIENMTENKGLSAKGAILINVSKLEKLG